MSRKTEQWASRWGFIAASMGMAIGTGNVWRFPRVAAANGGGPFIIAWTVALFVWSIPLLMGEMVIGRKTGLGTIGAFRDYMGKKYTWMGTWIAAVCILIMSYYSVIMGWCVKYFTLALSGAFSSEVGTEVTESIWNAFTTTPLQTMSFHAVSMLLAGIIIYRGVTNGIEKASKIMIPTLFVLLVLAAVRSITLPGAEKGLEFLFSPKISMLSNPKIWLEAFTQAAWSTGAGWGFIITYAVYTKRKEDVAGNCMIMGFSDNIGALICGMTVLPAIFALSATPEIAGKALAAGNTGLTFIYLAQLFTVMPFGSALSALFFLAMAIAALSSILPMIEVGVRNLMDAGLNRKKSTLIVILGGFLMGTPSAYSLSFNDNQDWVWSVGLLFSGLFVSIALMKYGLEKIRKNDINTDWADFKINRWWTISVGLFPAFVITIIGWWLWQAITWYPDNWWNPFEVSSVGTVLLQFAILLIIVFSTNNYLANRIGKGRDITKAPEEGE